MLNRVVYHITSRLKQVKIGANRQFPYSPYCNSHRPQFTLFNTLSSITNDHISEIRKHTEWEVFQARGQY
jgi:hypothetical protein